MGRSRWAQRWDSETNSWERSEMGNYPAHKGWRRDKGDNYPYHGGWSERYDFRRKKSTPIDLIVKLLIFIGIIILIYWIIDRETVEGYYQKLISNFETAKQSFKEYFVYLNKSNASSETNKGVSNITPLIAREGTVAPLNKNNPICFNFVCEIGESSENCCSDCGCSSGYSCVNNACVRCGDLVCDPKAESKDSCCSDCGCRNPDYICYGNVCKSQDEIKREKAEQTEQVPISMPKFEPTRPRDSNEQEDNCKAAFESLNTIRASYGRITLEWDNRAYELAVYRSKDMATRGYFDHVTPEGTCASEMKSNFGFSQNENIAENIWMTYYVGVSISGQPRANPNEAVTDWMGSRGHRYNLLYPDHTKGAIGCYVNVCTFYGVNTKYYGFGYGPCTTGSQGLAYWETAPQQLGEV